MQYNAIYIVKIQYTILNQYWTLRFLYNVLFIYTIKYKDKCLYDFYNYQYIIENNA